jgi:hypothetical protein
MKRRRFLRGLKFAPLAALFVALIGLVVMSLWNWLIPAVIGWQRIGFWQALGLLILSKILFGGFHGRHGSHGNWHGRMMERWGKMTPEEREKFRQTMRHRCGPFGACGDGPPAERPSAA